MLVKSGYRDGQGRWVFWFAKDAKSVWHPLAFAPELSRNPVYMRGQIEWVRKQIG